MMSLATSTLGSFKANEIDICKCKFSLNSFVFNATHMYSTIYAASWFIAFYIRVMRLWIKIRSYIIPAAIFSECYPTILEFCPSIQNPFGSNSFLTKNYSLAYCYEHKKASLRNTFNYINSDVMILIYLNDLQSGGNFQYFR